MAREAGFLIAGAFALATAAQAAPSGPDLQAALRTDGPMALIKAHFDPDKGDGYAAIEAGSPEAIGVAADLLKSDADGAVTLSLRSSLAVALQEHPERVLPLVDTHPALGANAICVPFLPADEKTATLQATLDRTRAALASPTARAFGRQASECRAVLAQSERSLHKHRSPK